MHIPDYRQSWATALTVSNNIAYLNAGSGFAYYTDAGAEWINLAANAVWDYTGVGAISGCEPSGHLHTSDNYYPVGIVIGTYTACWSDPLTDTVNTDNYPIPASPGPVDIPSSLISAAGLQGEYQSISRALAPEVDYTGISSTLGTPRSQALIAGVGFSPSTHVSFGGVDLTSSLHVLSDGFMITSLPALAGRVAFPLPITIGGDGGMTTSIFEANAVGIFTDGTSLSSCGFDGNGYAYSAKLMGASKVWNGITFTFGPPNSLDAVRGMGQTVVLPPGEFSGLLMLGASVNGAQTAQTFTVNYSDGTSSSFAQKFSDWASPSGYSGETIVATMPYRDFSVGSIANSTIYLYGYDFALDHAKTVESVTLPNDAKIVFLGIAVAP